jgi:hypothetical protein
MMYATVTTLSEDVLLAGVIAAPSC